MSKYDAILDTPPVPSFECLEVHMLVGTQFLLRTLWSLKTFWYSTNCKFYVIFHDDGTLSPADNEILQRHFPGCTIIGQSYADKILDYELRDFPLCHEYRVKNLYGKRLFDPFIFSYRPYILMMDSDVLWYKDCLSVYEWSRSHTPFYMDAGGPGTSRSERWLEGQGIKPAHHFNECLIGMPIRLPLEFRDIEDIFRIILSSDEMLVEDGKSFVNTGVGSYKGPETTYAHLGQTAFAVLMQRIGNFKVIPFQGHIAKYHWSPIWEILKIEDAILYHHVWDEKFKTFFRVGVEYLIEDGFLDQYRKRIDTYADDD